MLLVVDYSGTLRVVEMDFRYVRLEDRYYMSVVCRGEVLVYGTTGVSR